MQHGFLHYKCFGGTGGKKVSSTEGQRRRGPEMAPFTAAQCRGWTLLGCVVERYPWSRGNVDAKGAPVTLLTLLGHPPDVGLNSPAALARIGLDPMVLTGLVHTDHLLSVRDLRSRGPNEG